MLLYPDTNILLHYRRLDEIDWCAIADTDDVTLVVSQVVIRELEQHKYQHPVKRLRNRAGAVVSFLHEQLARGIQSALPVSVREGVSLDFQRAEPRIDFVAAKLIESNQDDQLIATILARLAEAPGSDARIVTADLGLQVKAFQHQIQVLGLPDDLRIAEGPDPQDLEIAELRQKLVRYEKALPRVSLAFDSGEGFMRFVPPAANVLDENARHTAVTRLAEEAPKMSAGQPMSARLPGGITVGDVRWALKWLEPSEEEVQDYNEKVDEFYESYSTYLETRDEYRVLLSRTVPVALWLENTGTAPADDLDVFVDFPAGLKVVDAEDFPSEPPRPEPPEKPRSRSPLAFSGGFDWTRLMMPHMPDLQPLAANASGPTIDVSEGGESVVSYHVRRLKHNQSEALDALRVVFLAETEVRSFSIAYRIHVGNLPDEITGTLHIAIGPGDGGGSQNAD